GKMITDGAAILDVGGCSSRPGSTPVSEQQELDRVLPVISELVRTIPGAIISVDTFRPSVAEAAYQAGAGMVNNIEGVESKDMIDAVAELQVPYIIMHKKGDTETMQNAPEYKDVALEVLQSLTESV